MLAWYGGRYDPDDIGEAEIVAAIWPDGERLVGRPISKA
ncbi:hypothetical protein MPOCJGCO_2979 [Methylobacterium trifolii]|uniref:Uncharacterized protein n=1 Tax=Methylobacterium trifolii TaxID=1003092 RepID=A0ABQ4U4X1_9HYPH|nr:hypothetical protein MPOCJGCO_2979 [Methylobacterium trifolii]